MIVLFKNNVFWGGLDKRQGNILGAGLKISTVRKSGEPRFEPGTAW